MQVVQESTGGVQPDIMPYGLPEDQALLAQAAATLDADVAAPTIDRFPSLPPFEIDDDGPIFRSCAVNVPSAASSASSAVAKEKPLDKLRRVTTLLRKVNAVAKRFAGNAKMREACAQMRSVLIGEEEEEEEEAEEEAMEEEEE